MLEKERQYRIMQELNRNGYVAVKDMMTLLGASRSSIMRDLIAMEEEGLLVREHGGASLKTMTINAKSEVPTSRKADDYLFEKKAIAQEALKRIADGSTIYIDSGTTTACMAEYLSGRQLTIVTPSIYLLRLLPDDFLGTIELIGGSYDRKYETVYGADTFQQLMKFRFDQAFFSTNGIDLKRQDVSLVSKELGVMKTQVLKNARMSYLLIDRSKLNVAASYTWASLDDFDEIFMNGADDDKELPDNVVIV